MENSKKAVVDRVVADLAVLLVGESETEHQVPRCRLPDGAGIRSWLRVVIEDQTITTISLDLDETSDVQSRIEQKLNRLRQRGRNQ